ncbi:Ig-like domain-containing protein [Mesorhizobium opportunistum]|uniref:beta strand repeat-containing protein n=2 Tax=Mesorhizobium TaxID=68287 RepID=UPI002019B034|nr:Ig-like domain-containing protein [Mesorhizobium opportunistum]UQS66492.1 Ig-like domain-containing protein [Mesorhizobium opportunistum]
MGDHITNDTSLTINGTAEANSTVTVFQNGVSIGTALADGSGNWSRVDSNVLANGTTYQFTATQTDVAGNTSAVSASYAATIDTTAATPVITGFTTDSGTVGDHITNDTSLTINGTAEANSTVTVFQNGVSIGTALADGSGNWSRVDSNVLANGTTYQFTATQTDVAGNTSAVSASYAATIDTTAATPVITGFTTDSGTVGDHITNDTSLTINGTAEANSTVTVFQNGVSIGTALADGSGNWSRVDSNVLANGTTYQFTATQTDVAGNTSAVSASYAATIDTTAATPVITGFTTDSGTVGDHITNDTSLTINGTAEANSTVTVFQNGVSIGTALADGSGNWSRVDSNVLANGTTYQFTATQTDVAGNTSAVSASYAATIDTSGPTVSSIVFLTPNPDASDFTDVSITFSEAISNFDASDLQWQTNGAGSPVTLSATSTPVKVISLTTVDNIHWALQLDYSGSSSSGKDNGRLIVTPTYTDISGNIGATGQTTSTNEKVAPAGIAGQLINLALTDPGALQGNIAVTVAGVPLGWTLSEGTDNGDGSWTVQTNNIAALSITSPNGYVGALTLNITEYWTNADGSMANVLVTDNVEAYALGSPIFAWSGNDVLTGSSGNDLFVFSQPIGNDAVHSFDAAADQIDLVGYSGFQSFADVQGHTADDANGNAVITLGDGQSITLDGVHSSALGAGNFAFNQTPVLNNPGAMTIGDGALLPLSGGVNNSGTISLGSTGSETLLQVIQHGVTLQGGGQIDLSDSSFNIISGTGPDVTLVNVDNTISGAGQLGDGMLSLDNRGTIIASGTNALVIDTGGSVVANSGTLEATGSGGLVVAGGIANSGMLWANGGNIDIHGAVTGEGDATIGNLSKLEFGAASSTDVTFAQNTAGTLELDDSFDFSGRIGGITNDDKLDLNDILFGTGTTVSYQTSQDGSGGTLTVTDGTHGATLHLLGSYDANGFKLADDGEGHTVVTYNPAEFTLTGINGGTSEFAV